MVTKGATRCKRRRRGSCNASGTWCDASGAEGARAMRAAAARRSSLLTPGRREKKLV
ncbi:uncharacterized protein DS421_5g151780 [Arachis hypogaea]|nr:uncharacterized protein DS421_5g151780 [Arachis hypogaea]